MKKNVHITGSSRVIGKAIKNIYLANEYNVIEHSKKILDLSKPELVSNFYETLFEASPPEILILNASINENRKFENVTSENIMESLNISLLSNMMIIQKGIKHMLKNKFGRIVLIGSIWSSKTRPLKTVYSINKSSLKGICNSLSVEYAKENILTNIVSPGFVNTEMTKKNITSNQEKEFIKRIPLQRFAEPEEISEMVYFLGSENNTYITGQEIFVDGGFNIA